MSSSPVLQVEPPLYANGLKRVEGIDRLRACAALSVVLAHVVGPALPGPFRYLFTGHPAVIAFFVISGFCIHRPYVERPLALRAFWISRALRILPPTLAALCFAKHLGIQEFNFTDGYILWSVVCELWYYALYPIFRTAARVVSWDGLVVLSTIIWIVLIVIQRHDQYGNANAYGPWINWLIALPSWLIGCALAERRYFHAPVVPIIFWRITVAVTASILYWATLNTAAGFYITMNPFALLVAAWIRAEIGAARSGSILDRIGQWSFSIYLFHVIAWVALMHIGARNLFISFPIILLGCYVFAIMVEAPSHRLARRAFVRLAPSTMS